MSFDALTLSAVRDEIEPLLVNGRIQKVVFPDETSLAVEVFAPSTGRTAVLLSAHPEYGRVQLLSRLPARGLERDTPFALVTRKRLRQARVRSIRQPRWERVLELECEQRDEFGRHDRVLLIVEAMGRRGNLVLVGSDGSILDAVRRSPPSRNPRRPVLPHMRYVPPPPQQRLAPDQLVPELLAARSRGQSGTLAGFLSETLAGLSPLAARELAFRITGIVETPLSTDEDWPAVVEGIHAFVSPLDSHRWQPCLAIRDEQPVACAPYHLDHLAALGARIEAVDSISQAIGRFYTRSASPARGDVLAAERRQLLQALERAAATATRRLSALQQQLDRAQHEAEPLRHAGELILAYQSALPLGSTELRVDDQRFELDPRLSAVDNAQAAFARYRRLRDASERVPELLDAAQQQLEHLQQLRALVEVADSMDAVRALRQEVAEASGGHEGSRKARSAPRAPYRRVGLGDGWEALVGTSAAGNAAVTFEQARPHDWWLHAHGVPGAHVILRGEGEPPPPVLERAAELAAWYSAARSAARVEVDVAPRRYVRKIPHGPPGLVRYTNERTVRVKPSA